MIRSRFGQVVINGPVGCEFALSTFIRLSEGIQRQDISDISVIRLEEQLARPDKTGKGYSPAEHWNTAPGEGYRVQLPR